MEYINNASVKDEIVMYNVLVLSINILRSGWASVCINCVVHKPLFFI